MKAWIIFLYLIASGNTLPYCPSCKYMEKIWPPINTVCSQVGILEEFSSYEVIPMVISLSAQKNKTLGDQNNCHNTAIDTLNNLISDALSESGTVLERKIQDFNDIIFESTSQPIARRKKRELGVVVGFVALGVATAALAMSVANTVKLANLEGKLDTLITKVQDINTELTNLNKDYTQTVKQVSDIIIFVTSLADKVNTEIIPALNKIACGTLTLSEIVNSIPYLTRAINLIDGLVRNSLGLILPESLINTEKLTSIITKYTEAVVKVKDPGKAQKINNSIRFLSTHRDFMLFIPNSVSSRQRTITGVLLVPIIASAFNPVLMCRSAPSPCTGVEKPYCQRSSDALYVYKENKYHRIDTENCKEENGIYLCHSGVGYLHEGSKEPCKATNVSEPCPSIILSNPSRSTIVQGLTGVMIQCQNGVSCYAVKKDGSRVSNFTQPIWLSYSEITSYNIESETVDLSTEELVDAVRLEIDYAPTIPLISYEEVKQFDGNVDVLKTYLSENDLIIANAEERDKKLKQLSKDLQDLKGSSSSGSSTELLGIIAIALSSASILMVAVIGIVLCLKNRSQKTSNNWATEDQEPLYEAPVPPKGRVKRFGSNRR